MVTVADASVELSGSVTVMPESTTTGVDVTLLPSVNDVVPLVVVTTGASFTAVILTCLVAVLLLFVPSFTTKLIVLVEVFGVSELFVYVTALNADCHWESVAVAPELVSKRTPELYVPVMFPMVLPSFVKPNISCPV